MIPDPAQGRIVFHTSHYRYRSEITEGVTRCACVWDDGDECAHTVLIKKLLTTVQLELQGCVIQKYAVRTGSGSSWHLIVYN
jgi:hypothetical protein